MDKPILIITVDGGAASGKSTTSHRVAEQHHLLHVDTGSHYRAVSLGLLKARLHPEDEDKVEAYLQELTLGSSVADGQSVVSIDGYLPSHDELRSHLVNKSVAKFAALPCVRETLLHYQRSQVQVARTHGFEGLIMEGRDIGSVIFPDAPLRFFLQADPETRALRRAAEGQIDSIKQRDRLDRTRKTAPLTCPEGAIRIDTGKLSIDEVVAFVSKHIDEVCKDLGV